MKKKTLDRLSDIELIKRYSETISLLKKRGILKGKNTAGDIGRLYALDAYRANPDLPDLSPVPSGVQNINAMSKQGERYCVKSTTRALTGAFHGLNEPESQETEIKKFEYVVIVLMDSDFVLEKIVELSWEKFLKVKKWSKAQKGWNISVTKSLLAEAKAIFSSEPDAAEQTGD